MWWTKPNIGSNIFNQSLKHLQVILRDKNIEEFDNNKQDNFKLDDLVNIECLLASHNKIKDLIGISTLTTLVELNLNYN